MDEREIIIEWLVGRPDDEAHPDFTRLAITGLGFTKYNSVVHGQTERLREQFTLAFKQNKLREYYNACTPESLVECFDGWCCHRYR